MINVLSLPELGSWLRPLALCLLGTMIAGCQLGQLAMDYRWAPAVHESPARLLRISGDKDPNFDIQFLIRYETSHRECTRTINWLSGTGEPRWRQVSHVVPSTLSEYSVIIPLDHFIPGPCQWGPNRITYSIRKGEIEQRIPARQPNLVLFGFKQYPMSLDYPTELPLIEIECEEMEAHELRCFTGGEKTQTVSPETKELRVRVSARTR